PALGGLVLGGVILYVPHVYGVGYATMDAILRGALSWPWLLLLLPVKMGATSLTLASGGSGGLFLPALYVGAIIGGLFGFGVGALFPTFTGPSGAYALVGMAAFLAGVVHCPITALLLLFEITGDYHIILPLMVSCTISTLVAKVLREESIYTIQLTRRGIDIRRREANLMQAFTVGQVMRQDVPTLPETASFPTVVQYFLAGDMPVCFVVDTNRHLRGYISLHHVKTLLQEDTLDSLVIAKDLAQNPGETAYPGETLARCLEKFARTDQEYLPVISPTTKELQGCISQRDVLELYYRELIRHEYIGLSLRTDTISTAVLEQVRLPHTYTVAIVQVPPRYVGQTLRALQLRTRHNLTVVAIRRGGFHNQDELPDPDQPLSTPDYLVLVGRPEDVRRFTAEDDTHPLSAAPSG
ncbi:MAG: chloride channel protein, partial [Candidatus Binatia bacterium]|nr:chloride channel protein [Candidatus Binatia bacterium]